MMPSKEFDPGSFANIDPSTRQRYWEWLWSDEAVYRMEAASDLGRVAVEPLQAGLLRDFPEEEVRSGRIKQMIGAMARQILEARGYEVVRSGGNIKDRSLFTVGTKYQKVSR